MRYLIYTLLMFACLSTSAQFTGGSDDGSNAVVATSQSLGESIYMGGENDGGIVITSATQSLGESIYTGGENDGGIVIASSTQSLGESIYTGGENDGNVNALASASSLGESIYTGGENDGSVIIVASASSLGESIFAGGENDGNVAILASASSLGESIFAGGENDGNANAFANGVSLAEGIFAGGEGAGFVMAFMANTPLPLTLLSFDAQWQQQDALVTWKTTNETEMDGYILERSMNGKDFERVYAIASLNSMAATTYSFTDEQLAETYKEQSIFYFRLKQVETSGKSEYSGVATLVNNSKLNFAISIFPNPVTDLININISNGGVSTDGVEIELFSSDGKLVRKLTGLQHAIRTEELSAGNYTLKVSQGEKELISQRILVIK